MLGRNDERVIVLIATGCGSVAEVGLLVVMIFYYLGLMRALAACAPGHRSMEPALVWLNMVPVLSVAWCFLTVAAVGNSLRREHEARGLHRGGRYGKPAGFALYAVGLFSVPVVLGGTVLAAVLGGQDHDREAFTAVVSTLGAVGVLGTVQAVLFVVYWVQVARHTRRLTHDRGEKGPDEERGRGFDADYRPR